MLAQFHLPTVERSVSYAVTVLASEKSDYNFKYYLIDENKDLHNHDSHVRLTIYALEAPPFA